MAKKDEGLLKNKVAVVTGAGHGIGKALSIGLAEAGAIVCCAGRTEPKLVETVKIIKDKGGKADSIATDVTNYGAVEALFHFTKEAFGGVDIVIINAARSGKHKSVEVCDPEEWQATINTNLVGAFHTAKAAIPHLKESSTGKIIFIGSGAGYRSMPNSSDYACSKSGLWMLTKTLAKELMPYDICVNELIPGPVKTDMTAHLEKHFKSSNEWFKKPEDVVPLALFLATQPSNGPTAQSFRLNRREL
jgi:3-oxoacyl-[acyl-carrier protein] reductase